ncbi:8-amino-7-oxononanoate synthase [Thiohalobacter sp.]|uniref:8-amino-7-oxononanoate synthase n=1 Tax=Thiohalobacter sp. TaxID=2025948 RepID=UPI0026314403|nr:8-amino-7-oxononanoate synthase [Thiohalobacter sp.]
MRDLSSRLESLRAEGRYRTRRIAESAQGPERVVDGERLLTFCSNDYLGLAAHPEVVAALRAAAGAWGVGSGAAHLISGHTRPHHELEAALAAFVGAPRALLFSTGYMANLGVAGALLSPGDRLFEDRLNHASLLDGARYSGARLVRYAHGDMAALAARLSPGVSGLIASDGLFSMDGDLAPLPELRALAEAHGLPLLLDEAHALGVLGHGGRGSLEHWGLAGDWPEGLILMGTLGKALGTFGAFVAGSEALIETLIQQARPYVFTTATPPALAAAALRALELAADPALRERLAALIERFRAGAAELGLPLMTSQTPIQPLLVGESEAALRLSEALRGEGLLVPAIRPPTVPGGSARLRITFSAAHEPAQVDRLLAALERHRGLLA